MYFAVYNPSLTQFQDNVVKSKLFAFSSVGLRSTLVRDGKAGFYVTPRDRRRVYKYIHQVTQCC